MFKNIYPRPYLFFAHLYIIIIFHMHSCYYIIRYTIPYIKYEYHHFIFDTFYFHVLLVDIKNYELY